MYATGLLDRLAPHVRTGNFACLETGLVATGVPPLVDLLRNMSENRRELLEAQAKHAADIERLSAITVTESAATRQLIAGVSGQLRALDEGVAGLPRVLLDELSTDNALNHARPLTREDMLRVVNSSVEQAVQDIRADLADLRAAFAAPLAPVADIPAAAPAAPAAAADQPPTGPIQLPEQWYYTFQHSGMIQVSLPADFVLQTCVD